MRMRNLRRGSLLAALVLAACSEHGGGPVAPAQPSPGPVLAELRCRVSRAAGTLACAGAAPEGARGNLIVGGQGRYVFLVGKIIENSPGVIAIDVTVQNLIPQPLGTADGTTPHPDGVRVFFHTAPVPNAGVVTIANARDTADYTGSRQPFFQYDEVLPTNRTSAEQPWRFQVSPEVTDFIFKVYVRAVVPFPNGYVEITPPGDSVDVGGSRPLAATVRSAVGDTVPGAPPVTWQTSDSSVATVSASGVVTGLSHGVAAITATSGARSGSRVVVVCAAPAVGQAVTLSGAGAAALCVSGGASGAEFVAIPTNTAEAGDLALAFTGAGIVPVSGPPTPARLPAGAAAFARVGRPLPDARWETALRERERREMAAVRAGAPRTSAGARRAVTPGVPSVGALMSLNVETDHFCSAPDRRTGRVAAVGTHSIIVADTVNPAGGFSSAEYAELSARFDSLVHPTVTGAFGAPADIDANGGRVVVFFTRAVNELDPPGAPSYTGGFALWRDHRTAAECPESNVGEILYMMVPDPGGVVNGNVRSRAFVKGVTMAKLAHEMEHLVNASRRFAANRNAVLEERWLDEGLAQVAEELVFYAASGQAPRSNQGAAALGSPGPVRDAFVEFQLDNFARYRQFLLAPEAQGPYQGDDDPATRGAAWAFLRYAADRRGGTETAFWQALVNPSRVGRDNLRAALGLSDAGLSAWLRDWTAAVYADDAVSGASAVHTVPSWDSRFVYSNFAFGSSPTVFPLVVRDPANGVAQSMTLAPGGAAYVRFGVPAGAKAGITLRSGGGTPPANVAVTVMRRK